MSVLARHRIAPDNATTVRRKGEAIERNVLWRLAAILLTPLAIDALTRASLPVWAVMWLMAFATYAVCKLLAWHACDVVAPWKQCVAFMAAWPGMNANAFLAGHETVREGKSLRPLVTAAGCLVAGAVLFWCLARRLPEDWSTTRAWLGMVGLVLMLHFGALGLIAVAWQRAGVEAKPLMNAPLLSTSVADFWGRRWNTAFRDLSTQLLFRPLARRWGIGVASWAVFLFSGVVHDLVISVPAGGGYGLPTAYFLLQGMAIQLERSALFARLKLDSTAARRCFAWAVVLGPAGLLFHEPFRAAVILPMMKAWGAL